MPYGDAWDSNAFPGSTPAKLIDDEIRKLRHQIEERVESVLIEDVTADPWVLKESLSGTKIGIQRIIPFCEFLSDTHGRENDLNVDGYVIGFADAQPYCAYLDISVGCTLVKLEWMISKDTAPAVACTLRRKQFVGAPPAATTLDTVNINVAGIVVVPSADLNITLDPGFMYYLAVIGSGNVNASYKIYGCRLTYNRDNMEHAS